MTKPLDPAFLALKRCVLALEKSPPEMIVPTLEYLWDKYVWHPNVWHPKARAVPRA